MSRPQTRPIESPHESVQSILDSLRRIVRALRVSSRSSEKSYGLTAAQLFVLHQLSSSPRPLSMNELAERTFTHQSSVSVVVSRLAERGLLSRTQSRKDARKVEIFLTAEGKRLLQSSGGAVFQNRLVEAIGKLGSRRGRELARLLSALVNAAGYEEGEAEMFDMVD